MSTNKYGIECVGRRRPTWKRRVGCWLWTLIACVLAAWVIRMIWAVLATLKHAEAGRPMLRVAGVSDWVAMWIVGTVVGVLLWRLMCRAREEASTYQDDGWDALALPPEHDPLEVGADAIPPSEGMPAGMTRLDVELIAHACASEVGLIRSLVQGAERSLSVEDYGDALAAAERRLGKLRVTLWELRARFSTSPSLPVSESLTVEGIRA